ncbi:MAG: DUF493 domain-containing protein [Gammaproteobacteria bacterium]|nr:DUF493 domain-containing protein [Gammaproteobacteria bacterium]
MSDEQSNNPSEEETLFEFPCEFPIKAMGKTGPELEGAVIEIINRHVPDLPEDAIKLNASKGGNYTSITIIVVAQSKDHLDAIYYELTACEHVLYAI